MTTKLDLDIVANKKDWQDIQNQIITKVALLKMADIATMLMLFIFMVGFYVADPFHLVTFITEGMAKNPAEMFTYFVLLAFAGIMAYTIAHLKREHYHHTARHNKNVWKVGFILVLFSMTGEIYNSLGSQQHSQFSKAESSDMFKAIANQNIVVGGSSGTALAEAESKLARCLDNVAKGKGKDCVNSQARVDSLKATDAANAKNAANAASAASEQKTKDMLTIVDMNVHPAYKALAELGIPQKVAMLLLAAFVAYAFERMHLTLPEDLKDLYQKKAMLEADLLEMMKGNLVTRNAQSAEVSQTPEIVTRGKGYEVPAEKHPFGFAPATASAFKYQSEKSEKIDDRPFLGFKDTNKQAKLDALNLAPGSEDRKTVPARTLAVSRITPHSAVYTRGVDTAKMTRQTDTADETQGICPQCGTSYNLTRWNKRFCSDHCKDAWHNAQRPERGKFVGKFAGK